MTKPYPAEAVERLRPASNVEWQVVDPADLAAILSYVETARAATSQDAELMTLNALPPPPDSEG